MWHLPGVQECYYEWELLFFFKIFKIYFTEREKAHAQVGGGVQQAQGEGEAGSLLSKEPNPRTLGS